MEVPAVIHFQIRSKPGDPGIMSGGMGGPVALLPPVLQKGLAKPGFRYRFACTVAIGPGPQHVMTHLACHVNCVKCRKTKEWIDAPDDGPFPKDPSKPPADEVSQFLKE